MSLRSFIDGDSSRVRDSRGSSFPPIPARKTPEEVAEEDAAFQKAAAEKAATHRESGGERRAMTLSVLRDAVVWNRNIRPLTGYNPNLEGFPLDRFPSPKEALRLAEESDNWGAAEAWCQEISSHDPYGGFWSTSAVNWARQARALPKGSPPRP